MTSFKTYVIYEAAPQFVVVAQNANQAMYFANNSETTRSRASGDGVAWTRAKHDLPLPSTNYHPDDAWFVEEDSADA